LWATLVLIDELWRCIFLQSAALFHTTRHTAFSLRPEQLLDTRDFSMDHLMGYKNQCEGIVQTVFSICKMRLEMLILFTCTNTAICKTPLDRPRLLLLHCFRRSVIFVAAVAGRLDMLGSRQEHCRVRADWAEAWNSVLAVLAAVRSVEGTYRPPVGLVVNTPTTATRYCVYAGVTAALRGRCALVAAALRQSHHMA
jgi:hypothetical protein